MTQQMKQPQLLLKPIHGSGSKTELGLSGEAAIITCSNTPFIVGTNGECNLVIDNSEAVSGKHLRFTFGYGKDKDHFFVESIGATGITLLNGIQLKMNTKHMLLSGDDIYLRKTNSDPEVLSVRLTDDTRFMGSLGGMLENVQFPEIYITSPMGEVILRGLSPHRWRLINPEAENLAPNEYKLIKALYEQQGRPFSKKEVGELLGLPERPREPEERTDSKGNEHKFTQKQWDKNFNNRIYEIRKKIERDGPNHLIIQRNSDLGMPDNFVMPKIHLFKWCGSCKKLTEQINIRIKITFESLQSPATRELKCKTCHSGAGDYFDGF